MKSIQETNSEIKLDHFKNILVNQLSDTSRNNIVKNKIIQTIDNLNDLQLIVLSIVQLAEQPATIYDIHLGFEMKNVYVRLKPEDELPKGVDEATVLESSIFLYFLEELVQSGLIRRVEMDGTSHAPLEELKAAYQLYIYDNQKLSNTRVIHLLSPFAKIFLQCISL